MLSEAIDSTALTRRIHALTALPAVITYNFKRIAPKGGRVRLTE
jgi:hypothetical protein